ncbi:hypothetical protein GETHOR_25640 [Geothrix oryzae]|uniref:Capsule polysaccharide biosynthesis protein n=1 Tax=Geothrix oryzae TaxID=2927975 RepID=A0ABM8DTV6_9BACT|nr:hypothetical protein [Geothrix oryzae]BDU70463.1 hypothetical protein GETHOR_25640 [Geothrix oryzae]
MKIAFHSPYSVGSNNLSLLLDEALEELRDEANSVVFVTCTGQLRPCDINYENSWIKCQECILSRNIVLKQINQPRFILKNIGNYIDSKLLSRGRSLRFDYDSIEDVKKIEYRGINLGLGVVSTYVSKTRNLDPDLNRTTRNFIDQLLQSSAILTESTSRMLEVEEPDRVCLVNGRFHGYRPFMEVGLNRQVETIVLENTLSTSLESMHVVRFENSLPHDIDNASRLIDLNWETYLDQGNREEVASVFYERRRNAEFASDRVYVAHQDPNLLPEDFDPARRNFVIFNSSEDEFFSIGDSFDKYKIFDNQIEGILYLIRQTLHDPSIHYYLRIHPNLINIKYKYHTKLNTMFDVFPNITVIPASSPISTYKLIDSCEKIIVFGSTVGIEGSYWQKPVILLGGAFYIHLNAVYCPKNFNELNTLLTDTLETKPRVGALKYALYIFGERGSLFRQFDFNCTTLKFGNMKIIVENCFRFKGTFIPYLIFKTIFQCLNYPFRFYFKKFILPKLQIEK